MERKTCATCAAFAPLDKECRRTSPLAVLVPGPNGDIRRAGIHPATTTDNWCCEHTDYPVKEA